MDDQGLGQQVAEFSMRECFQGLACFGEATGLDGARKRKRARELLPERLDRAIQIRAPQPPHPHAVRP